MQNLTTTQKLLILALAWFLLSGGSVGGKPDLVTYVYEKDDGAVPAYVASALSKINEQGINANPVDDDTRDGDGQIPDQYKAAFEAASKDGTPLLVSTSKGKVLRKVKSPKTEDEVLGVVK